MLNVHKVNERRRDIASRNP